MKWKRRDKVDVLGVELYLDRDVYVSYVSPPTRNGRNGPQRNFAQEILCALYVIYVLYGSTLDTSRSQPHPSVLFISCTLFRDSAGTALAIFMRLGVVFRKILFNKTAC